MAHRSRNVPAALVLAIVGGPLSASATQAQATHAHVTQAQPTQALASESRVTSEPPETFWRYSSALGYAGIGVGLGAAIALSDDSSHGSIADGIARLYGLVGGGALLGFVVGWSAGTDADHLLAGRRQPSTALRNTIRFGTVALGASSGALIAAAQIEGDDDNLPGEDERMLAMWTLGGAVLGGLLQWGLDDRLFVTSGKDSNMVVGWRLEI